MDFKDALDDDIMSTFLDASEFAERIEINGQEALAIMEEATESIKTRSGDGFTNVSGLGLFSHDITLYIKENSLEKKPVPGDELYIDGLAYEVSDAPNAVTVQGGILVLMLAKRYS